MCIMECEHGSWHLRAKLPIRSYRTLDLGRWVHGIIIIIIRLGLNVALTHQHRSLSRRWNKGKRRHRKGSREVETTRRGQRKLKINTTKKEKKQLIFVSFLAYNLSDLSGPWEVVNKIVIVLGKHKFNVIIRKEIISRGDEEIITILCNSWCRMSSMCINMWQKNINFHVCFYFIVVHK